MTLREEVREKLEAKESSLAGNEEEKAALQRAEYLTVVIPRLNLDTTWVCVFQAIRMLCCGLNRMLMLLISQQGYMPEKKDQQSFQLNGRVSCKRLCRKLGSMDTTG